MKKNTRFLLGLISSLLLACGFVRAAERLDPINQVHAVSVAHVKDVTPDTVQLCSTDDNGR